MATEPKWKNRVGKDWVTKKVLGQDWQYQVTDKLEHRLQNITIKQAGLGTNRDKTGLKDEFAFYELFQKAKSQHIPKMYRRMYSDVEHNTMQADVGHVE